MRAVVECRARRPITGVDSLFAWPRISDWYDGCVGAPGVNQPVDVGRITGDDLVARVCGERATKASMTSAVPALPSSSPARLASSSPTGATSIIGNARPSLACVAPSRHAWATTGAEVATSPPARRASSINPATRRSPRSMPIRAPASRMILTPHANVDRAAGRERRRLRRAASVRPRRTRRTHPGTRSARRR